MDFFHCNSCYSQPGPPKNLKFCLTSCGHTLCTDCLSLSSSKCKECQSACKVLPLTKDFHGFPLNKIPPNLQLYFTDLMKEVKKVLRSLLVQNKHYSIYVEEYGPRLESNLIRTKNMLDKKISEIDMLKQNNEVLMSEIERLKNEIIHFKQVKRSYPEKDTPLRDSRDIFRSGNINFGSRAKSVDNSYIFKPSSSKKLTGFFTSSPSDDSLHNQPQRMTPMAAVMKSTLRDNMRMLKPQTPSLRVNQTFAMASKSPNFQPQGTEEGSPGSWCSSISSIKSPFVFRKNSYFQKP